MDDTEDDLVRLRIGFANLPRGSTSRTRGPRKTCNARPEEQRAARALAAHEELAARRAAALQSARPPSLQLEVEELPYFPYAGRRGGMASETAPAECAICLEPLRLGQLCSVVPVCRHAFHKDCLGMWAKSNASCPLCRAKIGVLGSDDVVAVARHIV